MHLISLEPKNYLCLLHPWSSMVGLGSKLVQLFDKSICLVSQGQAIIWDAARHAQMHDPSILHSHNEMGSAGATTSFGGGSSFGGGGGGSSW